ncbi:hypothetical protein ACWEOE_28990 [Amycolatopsis sp. NPDC004368]
MAKYTLTTRRADDQLTAQDVDTRDEAEQILLQIAAAAHVDWTEHVATPDTWAARVTSTAGASLAVAELAPKPTQAQAVYAHGDKKLVVDYDEHNPTDMHLTVHPAE